MQLKTWLPVLLFSAAGSLSWTVVSEESPSTANLSIEEPQSGTFVIDAVHSSVLFRIQHLGISYSYGSFEKMSGELVLDADPAKCKVAVEVDANSVDTNNGDRDNHLRGPDFFNAAEFPTISFTSTGVRKSGANYSVTGKLEFHGVSKEVTFDMKLIGAKDVGERMGGYKVGFEGRLTIDRNDFDVKTYPDALGKDVELTLAIEAARK